MDECALEKTKDSDLIAQCLFTLYKFLVHPPTREAITSHQHLVGLILDFVADPNESVRQLSNQCLDIIMDTDERGFGWRDKIRQQRFEAYNREWLEVTKATASGGGGMGMGLDGLGDSGSNHSSPQHYSAAAGGQPFGARGMGGGGLDMKGARIDMKSMAQAQAHQHAAIINQRQYTPPDDFSGGGGGGGGGGGQHLDMSGSEELGGAGGGYHQAAHGGPDPHQYDHQYVRPSVDCFLSARNRWTVAQLIHTSVLVSCVM